MKNRCVVSNKEKASVKCEGCLQTFCYNHMNDHRQELNKQLDEIETTRDLLRQTLTGKMVEPRKHSLIQQIDKWERDSINKIRQAANEARQWLLRQTTKSFATTEIKLAKLTDQIRENREENNFVETDLNYWKNELTKLTNELDKSPNVIIRQDTTPLVTKILIDVSTLLCLPNIRASAKWIQNGVTVAGGNGLGNALNQFRFPYGIYVDDDQTMYVADCNNHRIMKWKSDATNGKVVDGGNEEGNLSNQFYYPAAVLVDKKTDSLIISDYDNKRVVRWSRQNGTRGETIISDVVSFGLAMDSDGYLYVSDYNKHEIKRWKMGEKNGIVVAGGNGKGSRFDQLNYPTCIFVDENHSVYVSDTKNHRVTKWMEGAKEGIVVAGGQGLGSGLTQLKCPVGIVVDQMHNIYVSDNGNSRVMRWLKGTRQGSVIVGGNRTGAQPNQFNNCLDLSFDRQGNLYVSDYYNHRVQKFNIDPCSN